MTLKIIFTTCILLFFFGNITTNAQSNKDDSSEIKSLLAKKRDYNKRYGYGYRIQLYNGLESRAKSLKYKFQMEFPEVYNKLEYKDPEWKVQVGNYKTRLEADKAINKIREKFSSAIVIPVGD